MTRTLLLILANVTACFSGLQAVPPLRELVSQAGEIIVGTISSASVTQTGDRNRPMSSVSIEIQVIRSLGGVLRPTQQLTLQWIQAGPVASPGSWKGDVGIWFLKRGAPDTWVPLPFVTPQPRDLNDVRVPTNFAQPGAAYQYSKDAPLTDKALLELLNAADQDASAQFSYIYWGAYDEYRPPIMEQFYRRLATSPSPAKAAQGLAGLIRLDRVDALLSVEREAQVLSPYLGQIALSIAAYFRSEDVTSISALGRMAGGSSGSPALRKAAAQALAFIHNDKCVPYLVGLMDSGDAELETLGTGGLAMFANGVRLIQRGASAQFSPSSMPGPYRSEDTIRNFTLDVEKFKSERASYLAFWRTWWNQNRENILGPPAK